MGRRRQGASPRKCRRSRTSRSIPTTRPPSSPAPRTQVYLTRDGGLSWTDHTVAVARSPGIKAVAVTSRPELLVFASHRSRDRSSRQSSGGSWREIGGDLGRIDPARQSRRGVGYRRRGRAPTDPWSGRPTRSCPGCTATISRPAPFSGRSTRKTRDFGAFDSLRPRPDGLVLRDRRRGDAPGYRPGLLRQGQRPSRAPCCASAALVPAQIECDLRTGSVPARPRRRSTFRNCGSHPSGATSRTAPAPTAATASTSRPASWSSAESRAKYDALMTDTRPRYRSSST